MRFAKLAVWEHRQRERASIAEVAVSGIDPTKHGSRFRANGGT
jgi:hypothetical protein